MSFKQSFRSLAMPVGMVIGALLCRQIVWVDTATGGVLTPIFIFTMLFFTFCRVDARKKAEYKAKFRGMERADWKDIQIEWMKYCLLLKYRCNALFRRDLSACRGKLPVEDATSTNYASNLFWGAQLVEVDGRKYYFGCNVLGKLLATLRKDKSLPYSLPTDLHLFGEPIRER